MGTPKRNRQTDGRTDGHTFGYILGTSSPSPIGYCLLDTKKVYTRESIIWVVTVQILLDINPRVRILLGFFLLFFIHFKFIKYLIFFAGKFRQD